MPANKPNRATRACVVGVCFLGLAVRPAQAGTCDALRDPLVDVPERDAEVWPALLACADEELASLADGCMAAHRPLSVDATASWSALPEVRAGVGGVEADRARAREAAQETLQADAAVRERTSEPEGRDGFLPAAEVPRAEAERLARPAEAAPATSRVDGPVCSVEQALKVADHYDRFIAALPAVIDQVPPGSLCSAYVGGAAARLWAGRAGAQPLLEAALGFHGAPCDPAISTLAGDPLVAEALVGAAHAVGTRAPSWLETPRDGATWWVDGTPLAADAADHLPLAPGVHRIGRDGAPPRFLVVELPPRNELRVRFADGRIVATSRPTSPAEGGGDLSFARLIRAGAIVGAGRLHAAPFGVVGASLEVWVPRTPLTIEAAGLFEVTTRPLYLSPTVPAQSFLRAELGVRYELLRRRAVSPFVAVAGYRESAVTWGIEPTVGARLDTRWSSITAGVGFPIAFSGEPVGGQVRITVRPGARAGTTGTSP